MRPIVLAFGVLAACSNHPAIVDTWRGHTADDLMVTWGAPNSVQRLDDGRRLLAYDYANINAGMSYQCRAWFVADTSGRIATARVEGDNGGCDRMLRGKSAR